MIKFINETRKKILRKKILNEVRKRNPQKILDDGCGKKGSFDYGEFKNRITAADITMGIDSENLPYEDNSFDLVIFAGVIQYTNNPDKAMRECYRVLRKGGVLIITTINTNSFVKKIVGFRDEKRSYTFKEFEDYISKFSFKVLDKASIDFPLVPKRYRMILYYRCLKI